MSKKFLRRESRRWHKRAGLVSAFFVVILSVSGLVLNHTDSFRLGQKPVSSPWVLALYGQHFPELRSFSVAPADKPLLVTALATHVYVEARPLHQCEQALR